MKKARFPHDDQHHPKIHGVTNEAIETARNKCVGGVPNRRGSLTEAGEVSSTKDEDQNAKD